MKKVLASTSLVIFLILATASPLASAATYTVTNISNSDGYDDWNPQITDDGHAVWTGWDGNDYEIYMWDGTTKTNITNTDDINEQQPQINNVRQVAWVGQSQGMMGESEEIYFWDGMTVTNISQNEYEDWDMKLNDSGYVVWRGYEGIWPDIYLWDGSAKTNISNTEGMLDFYPQINNQGQVVWQTQTSLNEYEIYLWDGTTKTNISNDDTSWDRHPQINNKGDIVWFKHIENGTDIYLWDGFTNANISNSAGTSDMEPQINNNGYVVWFGFDGNDLEIYLATPPSTIDDALSFFDSKVEEGTLAGASKGSSAGGRLGALRNMLEQARSLIESGDIDGACDQLKDIYSRTDGQSPPPDFVTGEAASLLATIIQATRANLGCD